MRLMMVLMVAGALSGCDETIPMLELGTGTGPDWVPLEDGGTADIVMGGQGGFHVDAAGRIGPYRQEARLSGRLIIPDAPVAEVAVASGFNQFLVNYDDSTRTGEFWAMQVRVVQQFNSANIIRNQMNGQFATLEVTVAELDEGNPITESVDVRLRFQQ